MRASRLPLDRHSGLDHKLAKMVEWAYYVLDKCCLNVNLYKKTYKQPFLGGDMDTIDNNILAILQSRARIKKSEMARELNIPATTLQERIRRLEDNGIIKDYQAVIDPGKIGLTVQAFVAVTLDRHEPCEIRSFEKNIKSISNIKACYHLSGRFDYLLHIFARDLNELGDLVKVRLTSLPDIGRCETYIVFSEIESSPSLSLAYDNSNE